MKFFLIIMIFFCYLNSGCSQNFGPGYSFELFKNTPNWELAKAVKNENEKEIIKLIKQKKVDINLQEPHFGNTLLLLAIGNDKLIATKVLLEAGADVNIADAENNKPIHEATRFINLKKNSFDIIRLLIKYGANVNDSSIVRKKNAIVKFYVPLMGASQNLRCGKLLLDQGANPYVVNDKTYLVWTFIDKDESIFFFKYLIINKRMPIPNPIDYSLPNNVPLDFFYFLGNANLKYDLKKESAKNDILNYLKKINFPINQVYK